MGAAYVAKTKSHFPSIHTKKHDSHVNPDRVLSLHNRPLWGPVSCMIQMATSYKAQVLGKTKG